MLSVRKWTTPAWRWRGREILTFIVGALLALTGPASAATDDPKLADSAIQSAIEEDFLSDPSVPFHSVDVEVRQGIATLSGSVDTLLARDRAVSLARSIKGVRAVVEELSVEPVARTDAELRSDIEQALAMDPAADSYEVAAMLRNGVATLTGAVDSWQEKQIVRRVAAGVKGVKEIDNQVTIQYTAVRPDSEMGAEIRERLHWDARVDDGLITVSVDGGTAKLDGTVGSAREKALATGLAWVAGVKQVDGSGLEVEWWARDDMRRQKYVARTDEEIERAIKDAFLYDPRVLSFNPDVSVDGGVVTLSGTVDNLMARRAAERDARNTVGVLLVRNHLRVRPASMISDQAVEKNVEQALARDPLIDRFGVGVTVFGGDVYLSGTVDSAFQKVHAEAVSSGIDGVLEVRNNLTVRDPRPYRTDFAIRQDIEDEMFWSPFIDSDDVNVGVRNGVATLTGTVDTWAEFAWASENAREGGALGVQNQLHVRNEETVWAPLF